MSKIIFLMAGLTGAAGVLLIGLGIPIQQFGLGNTLIGSGLTALVGAFVLFGLGAVLNELSVITQLLRRQSAQQIARLTTAVPQTEHQAGDHRLAAASDEPLPFSPGREDISEHEPVPLLRSERIVKSGVVDGLAYTLYADGSIDAELEEGTLRFGSVDQLQAYLRKSA